LLFIFILFFVFLFFLLEFLWFLYLDCITIILGFNGWGTRAFIVFVF